MSDIVSIRLATFPCYQGLFYYQFEFNIVTKKCNLHDINYTNLEHQDLFTYYNFYYKTFNNICPGIIEHKEFGSTFKELFDKIPNNYKLKLLQLLQLYIKSNIQLKDIEHPFIYNENVLRKMFVNL